VREYWLVDPRDRSVVIFLRTVKGEFTRSATLLADESSMLTTPLLPDFCLNVSQFFG
jgi:Uma2 family endonuclease